MRTYTDLVEESFYDYTGFKQSNSYSQINQESRNILDFKVPHGLVANISAQTTKNSLSEHSVSNLQGLKGTISYLYSSSPLNIGTSSTTPLKHLTESYRINQFVCSPKFPGKLLFGRMQFPTQQLQGMALHTIGRLGLLNAKWVVDTRFPTPFILTLNLQNHTIKTNYEFIYSSYENLLGFSLLSNLKTWTEFQNCGQLIAGTEVFYAANKKSPGLSIGFKYSKDGFNGPASLSIISNPLMGSLSMAYSVHPNSLSALSAKFDYNVYSYLSDLTIGCELWRMNPISLKSNKSTLRSGPLSVLKASTSLASQSAQVVWEGSFKEFLISTGMQIFYGKENSPTFWGIELTYSS